MSLCALPNSPAILLADEPTGNLDSATGASVIALFEQLNAEGLTIVVTRNSDMSRAARRHLTLRDGALCTDAPQPH